ncbi:hypothetical protein AG1IA_05759 [Rhizoctonia solani AG-1 IA]|uniref:Uncharacterized protein n=1 Tax=Thanatephorus cucumeris (strain AG1-IA) TaxID=983506 RepID=L8WTV9_THACA|nr:hypothetical protein AG1IA_05759 [Rhizoctonia solani AG-1 IA]
MLSTVMDVSPPCAYSANTGTALLTRVSNRGRDSLQVTFSVLCSLREKYGVVRRFINISIGLDVISVLICFGTSPESYMRHTSHGSHSCILFT